MSDFPSEQKVMIFMSALLNRGFIGFAIGISSWRLGWALHGILVGLIGSLPLSITALLSPEGSAFGFIVLTLAGAVWGFLLELLVTIVFKAPMKTAAE